MSKRLFRFVVASDTHFGYQNPGASPQREYLQRVSLLIDHLKAERVKGLDFFIINGDCIDLKNFDEFATRRSALETLINNHLDEVGVPYYLVPGNHDRIENHDWFEVLGYNRSHTFELNGFGFVLLDSSDVAGSRQTCVDGDYLHSALNEHRDKKGVFFLSHIPRFKGNFLENPDTDSPQCDDKMEMLRNADNLILCDHGHFHAEDGIQIEDGIPIVFGGHIGTYGLNYFGYRIYEVYEDSVFTQQWDMTNGMVRSSFTFEPLFMRGRRKRTGQQAVKKRPNLIPVTRG